MRIAYISPSVLPSRSANSVHVMQQCDALGKLGVDVTLFAKRSNRNPDLRSDLHRAYGVDLAGVTLRTIHTPWSRANNLVIAVYAIWAVMGGGFDAVLSRNLFASFALSLMGRTKLIIEVHQLEHGFRGWLQRVACQRAGVSVVVISEQLGRDLKRCLGDAAAPMLVLHDAAPDIPALPSEAERRSWRRELLSKPLEADMFVCGYVGHLYPGRGIEIIEALARECQDILFIVIGGNDSDVSHRRQRNVAPNLHFLGHVSHPAARRAMCAVDLLLMPYQEQVSIGIVGHDTGRWMSPMKMFEYMASGTAFIASDLPVLREVLRNRENAMLVEAKDVLAWREGIRELKDDSELRQGIARQAFQDYRDHYTWAQRAKRIAALIAT